MILKFVDPALLLAIYAAGCCAFSLGVAFAPGLSGIGCLFGLFFFESICYPVRSSYFCEGDLLSSGMASLLFLSVFSLLLQKIWEFIQSGGRDSLLWYVSLFGVEHPYEATTLIAAGRAWVEEHGTHQHKRMLRIPYQHAGLIWSRSLDIWPCLYMPCKLI